MDDCENLTKLLSHLQPAVFRTLLNDQFALTLPETDPQDGKRAQRAVLKTAVAALDVTLRQRLDAFAEGFVLLSDGPGQDVMASYGTQIFDDAERTAFAALRSQYDRALWLYCHEPALFAEALNARQADIFRQSQCCYSGFCAPPGLAIRDEETVRAAFRQAVSPVLDVPADQILVEIFKRLRPTSQTGQDVAIFQISLHHNRPTELVGYIQDGAIETQEVTRMEAAHITYEPATGHLEVLSRHDSGRDALARLTADHLLAAPFMGERIPIKQYDYQCLAGPFAFNLLGDPEVASVKVTELGCGADPHRHLRVSLWASDPDDIHTVARRLAGPAFDFRHHLITFVRLSIRLKKTATERARTLSVILRDGNRCNIKTKREKDRVLCDRLLTKWRLVKELGDDVIHPLHARAA